jgi:hypothetical protein
VPNPSSSDSAILSEVRTMYLSPLMQRIRQAHLAGKADTVQIGGCTVQYEPIAFSGMTAFPSGFVVGKEAFASEDEFKKTLLHETYRLRTSGISRGQADADKHNIKAETNAAFQFAERMYLLV